MHFLSSFAWYEDSAVRIKGVHGGSHFMPIRGGGALYPGGAMGAEKLWVQKRLDVRDLPDPDDAESRLALAFYREGMGLDHIGYKFLSFYKIINLYVGRNGKAQKEWINNRLGEVSDREAVARRTELQKQVTDVGKYLYASCRCAVAHAGVAPTMDPENLEDQERLTNDIPLIRDLGRIVIEEAYNVQSRTSVWQTHLHELKGLKEVWDAEVVNRIVKGAAVDLAELEPLPRVSLRLAHSGKFMTNKSFSVFEGLVAEVVRIQDGVVAIRCDKAHLCSIDIGFDFREDRLLFAPTETFTLADNGTMEAVAHAIDYYEFLEIYFSNGELELWDCDREELLGYKDPYVPVNIDPQRTFAYFRDQIRLLKQKHENRRRKRSESSERENSNEGN